MNDLIDQNKASTIVDLSCGYNPGALQMPKDKLYMGAKAPDFLESCKKMEEGLADGSEIILDVQDLDYISSAGFRVLMIMVKAGHPVLIRNADENMKELFEQMGFHSIVIIVQVVVTL